MRSFTGNTIQQSFIKTFAVLTMPSLNHNKDCNRLRAKLA